MYRYSGDDDNNDGGGGGGGGDVLGRQQSNAPTSDNRGKADSKAMVAKAGTTSKAREESGKLRGPPVTSSTETESVADRGTAAAAAAADKSDANKERAIMTEDRKKRLIAVESRATDRGRSVERKYLKSKEQLTKEAQDKFQREFDFRPRLATTRSASVSAYVRSPSPEDNEGLLYIKAKARLRSSASPPGTGGRGRGRGRSGDRDLSASQTIDEQATTLNQRQESASASALGKPPAKKVSVAEINAHISQMTAEYKKSLKDREKQKKELSKLEMLGCTFKPQITKMASEILRHQASNQSAMSYADAEATMRRRNASPSAHEILHGGTGGSGGGGGSGGREHSRERGGAGGGGYGGERGLYSYEREVEGAGVQTDRWKFGGGAGGWNIPAIEATDRLHKEAEVSGCISYRI
jgi:hypothetical protein